MPLLTASVHQLLLFAHILAFAFAIVAVLRADLALLTALRIDPSWPLAVGRPIFALLVLLWLSGGALTVIEYGFDLAAIAAKPKMMAKLTVVTLLTVNGFLLHSVAFPLLARPPRRPRIAALVCTVLGAVSTTTWLFAAFVGEARLIAPHMRYADFMLLYLAALALALGVALWFVRPRIERLMAGGEVYAAEAVGQVAAR